ncbi:Rieske 2Fe-2S domain-containing protein [Algoriphagus aestuariicola]|jgi:nitrite reductase/ring-hydroxylating ferredoxin subunit|uniref:Rieske 2Fe-2S domain-containing protein n=1 Tax=Algoriphagus aestuariicola TaxID=1852016 RepID=A0ABS3BT94_9BACT|nr:Rieske 2Fe-2S domain-containing protein [Algoriphagus aestuariicola]MBN7802096.1 Rieske 2Fe-2S domain-containing protein [Algoriphagus aestuariicola]
MKEYSLGSSREQVLGLFPERMIKKIQLGEKLLGGVRIGEKIFVFDANCPHRGAPLTQGTLNGLGEIICPLHEYRFDLSTGNVRAGSCGDLEVYKTRIDANGLKIMLP